MSRHGTYDLKYGFIPDDDYPQEIPKHITNADRIRAMSDEEMADFLGNNESYYLRYDKSWLEWLKQEAN